MGRMAALGSLQDLNEAVASGFFQEVPDRTAEKAKVWLERQRKAYLEIPALCRSVCCGRKSSAKGYHLLAQIVYQVPLLQSSTKQTSVCCINAKPKCMIWLQPVSDHACCFYTF